MNPDWQLKRGKDRSPNGPRLNGGGFGETALPKRKSLIHEAPDWVPEGATFFITINTLPRGKNQLAIPAITEGLVATLVVRIENGQWWPRLMLFMPDHIHGLIVFPEDRSMKRTISDWKRYTARNTGIRWQRDFFDHRIRNEASLAEKWNYIVQNPVRAGLVTSAEAWPYVWFGRDVSPKRPMGRDGTGRDRSPSGP
jgi:putative transposase